MHAPLQLEGEVIVVGLESVPPAYLGYPPETSAEVMADDIRANVMFDLMTQRAQERFLGDRPEAGWEGDFGKISRWAGRLHFLTKAEYAARLTETERYDEGEFLLRSGDRLDIFGAAAGVGHSHGGPPTVVAATSPDTALRTPAPRTLNLDTYPHITDVIVASSSPQTLMQLEATSHRMSDAVHRQVEHVWLTPSADLTTFILRNRDGVLPGFDMLFPIRPRPDVEKLDDYEGQPLEHYGPWEMQAVEFPAMDWGDFVARSNLLRHTRVIDFPDPLLNHLGPLVTGLRGIEVARMVSCPWV
jgi:hypothetical protein